MRRDMYATKADCMQDWGSDPAKCEPRQTRSGSSTYTHYYGPAYRHGYYGSSTRSTLSEGSTSEARPGSRSIGTTHVSRSGFGSSASSHGSSSGHASSSGS